MPRSRDYSAAVSAFSLVDDPAYRAPPGSFGNSRRSLDIILDRYFLGGFFVIAENDIRTKIHLLERAKRFMLSVPNVLFSLVDDSADRREIDLFDNPRRLLDNRDRYFFGGFIVVTENDIRTKIHMKCTW